MNVGHRLINYFRVCREKADHGSSSGACSHPVVQKHDQFRGTYGDFIGQADGVIGSDLDVELYGGLF